MSTKKGIQNESTKYAKKIPQKNTLKVTKSAPTWLPMALPGGGVLMFTFRAQIGVSFERELKSRNLRFDCSILALFMNPVFVQEGTQVALQMGFQGRGQKVSFSLVFAILA